MTRDHDRTAPPTVRDLRRGVTGASDPQVLRILRTVESIDERGAADELISPLRDRLLMLRPPRRLRFSRLLFHPLDPLIVGAGQWHPDRQALPRSMLAPMSACVRDAIGGLAARIDDQTNGKTTADAGLIDRLGRALWPAAALARAEPPDHWARTGMTEAHFRHLARSAGALLGEATALDALSAATLDGLLPCPADALNAIVRNVEAAHAPALGMMLALVLIRFPDAVTVLANPGSGTKLAAAVEETADQLIARMHDDGPDPWISSASHKEAAGRLRRAVGLLKQLEAMKGRPARKEKCLALRLRLDAACKARFRSVLTRDLIEALLVPNPPPAADLEAAARGLRVLETEARGIIDGRPYDALLAEAMAALASPAVTERLSPVDRVRLTEIIGGPDAALALLRGA
jgi:hypothetical protein